ncbi:MAG: hypothetical protein ACTSUP_07875 [Candidatus Heimdallarchaeaceae archaeon]
MDLSRYINVLNTCKIKKKLLQDKDREIRNELDLTSVLYNNLLEARDIMSAVGIISQEEIKNVIETLVTQALQGVFGDSYSFELDDKIAHNKPETDFYVVINGKKRSLRDELGGGVVDVISFVLRIVLWAIASPRTEAVLGYDEPLKFVSQDKLPFCAEMIKKLSEMLGLQFVIVTHESQLAEAADSLFHVEQSGGISKIS